MLRVDRSRFNLSRRMHWHCRDLTCENRQNNDMHARTGFAVFRLLARRSPVPRDFCRSRELARRTKTTDKMTVWITEHRLFRFGQQTQCWTSGVQNGVFSKPLFKRPAAERT